MKIPWVQKYFKVPSKCLFISWICWFDLVRKMCGFLYTSHAPITVNKNLSNKPYFCLSLLANLEDLLRPVDSRSIILGIFDPFSTSRYGILLGVLNYCWSKQTLLKFEFFVAPLEAGSWITSEINDPYIYGPYLTCGTYWYSMEKFLLFSGAMLGSWCWVSLWSFSQYRVNQVSLGSIFSDAPLCELC